MSLRNSILLAALLAVAACGDDDDGGQGPETPEGDVAVRNNFFQPDELNVQPGTTVVWAWQGGGGVAHNVTFDDGEASGNQDAGTYERTFTAAGAYPYHCTIHGTPTTGMRGVVTVAEAGTGGNPGGY